MDFKDRYKLLNKYINLNAKSRNAFRINTLKISENQLIKKLSKKIKLEKIPFLKYGYWYESKFSLASSPEYLLGHIYIQEAGSQIPVEILNPKPNEIILDIAAAPGGKTTQIAMYMKNKGTLIAVEKQYKRIRALKNNIQRLGVENSIIYNMNGEDINKLNIKFDKILVDAPCMGNFADDPKWFNNRKISQITSRQKIQRRLLSNSIKSLKRNGILVYSTCSLEPEENEINIDWLLNNFNVKLDKIDKKIGEEGLIEIFGEKLNKDIKKTKRIWPGVTQGFFIAKIKKL